ARRRPGRAGAALCGLAPIFAHDALALQDRVVRLAVKLAPHADEPARETVREAAAGLPAGLREKIAAAYGELAEEPAVAVPELVPPEGLRLPPPIASPAELAHELAVYHKTLDRHGHGFERLLSGLAEWSAREPDALREALRPWWQPFDPREFGDYGFTVQVDLLRSLRCAFLAFASPEHSGKLGRAPTSDDRSVFDRLPLRRASELATAFEERAAWSVPPPATSEEPGAWPVLLATPTEGTGHVDPEVLLERLGRLEAAGVPALPADLAQALLRLPRAIDPAVVERAGRLTSEAGRACAAWMRDGGLRDPEVMCHVHPVHGVVTGMSAAGYPPVPIPGDPPGQIPGDPPVPITGDPLVPVPDLFRPSGGHTYGLTWWPSVMPSHREVVAAHLLRHLPSEVDQPRPAGVLADLARGDGPVGIATAYALVCGLGQITPEGRASATDALLTLAARGEAPVAELAEAVAELVTSTYVKLNRVVAGLDDATRAGAHEVVWAVIVRLLPVLLPAEGERPRAGLADLLATGARAAKAAKAAGAPAVEVARAQAVETAEAQAVETAEAQAARAARAVEAPVVEAPVDLSALTAVAGRKGASRLVQEARRLAELIGVTVIA
ncbi:MAG: hypothetical protein HOV96_10185, partial [Nonomuraea sp.]|nr:hypothetical protein [Nonomuraea sp.]